MIDKIMVNRRNLLIAAALFLAIGAIAGLMSLQGEASRPPATAGLPAGADVSDLLYAAEPGEGSETAKLMSQDAYWDARYTYPTGKADRKWLADAAKEDSAKVRSGVPAGQVIYDRNGDASNSPLVLNPNRWTSIGPQPQDSNTCQVCFSFGVVAGRVNDIVVDPISPTIAYIASDGGGVWKTTNCCSPATTWTSTMDGPLISTTAIGDLALDPTNHTVYAGTGDLRFGSFGFGSAGLLKSTDLGATWETKGADVFGNYYPRPVGEFPQYDSIGKVAIDPQSSNKLIVGTKQGVWLSYNGGDNWAGPCLPDPFPTQRQDITAVLAMTNTNGMTDLFVAVGSRGFSTTVQPNLADNGANGIYRATVPASSGCPANWTPVSRPNNGWPAGSASGNPIVSNGTQYVSGNPLGRIDMAFAPSNPNYIYAEVQAISVGAVEGTIQRGGMLGIWRSTDRGNTWELRTTAQDLEDAQDACGGTCVGDALNVCGDVAQNWYDQHIAVDPNNPDVIFWDNINIWKSTDGGLTIRDITCGYSTINVPRPVHVDQHAITFLPGSSSRILFGNDGGVYLTENGNTVQPAFVQLNNSLNTIEFYGGDISANFANSVAPFAVAGAQDNGSSSWTAPDPNLGPYLWQQRIGGDGMYARIEPVLGQNVYMEAQNGALRRSESGHPGPYPLLSAATNYSVDAPRLSFIFPYEIYKGVPLLTPGGGEDCPATGCKNLIAGTYRVWENNGGALTNSPWVVSSQDLTKRTLGDRSFINQLAYASRTDNIAIAGTNDGNVALGFNLHMRPAMSATWVNVTGGNTVLPNRPILDVALDPSIALTSTSFIGYAAVGGFDQNTPSTPGHVFQVTCTLNCASSTWANKSGNLPNIPIDSITANPRFPQQVFAGSDWGVYVTNDISAVTPTWFRFNAGMPNVMVWDFAIDRGFTTVAAFTRSRGTFVFPLTSAPIVLATVTGTPATATATFVPLTRTPIVPATFTAGPPNTAVPSATSLPSATPLPCGSAPLLFEGFEGGTLGVFTTTLEGQPWVVSTAVPYSGSRSAYVPDNAATSDQRLEMRNAISVPVAPANSTLQFYHRFKFEVIQFMFTFDGGVLEYSVNNGVTWTDAGALITEGGYNAVIGGPGNPLNGRQGYGGVSPNYPAYERVTVNLNTLRGQSVKFRFRHGSDESGGEEGWYVDDVNFFSGTVCATGTVVVTPGVTGTATATRTGTALVPTVTGTSQVASVTATQTGTVGVPSVTATPILPTVTSLPGLTTTPTSTGTVLVPSVTATLPVATGTATRTGTVVAPTVTASVQPLVSGTPTVTVVVPSVTATAPPVVSGTPANTVAPTTAATQAPTFTAAPSITPGGPTLTRTPVPPTITPGGPTMTRTPVPPTITPGGPTLTPVPPTATPTVCPIQFSDVPADSTFYANIRCLACRGILGGYSDGTFRPNNPVTRGQLSKIVANSAGFLEPVSGQRFTDVAPGSTFYEFIERMASRGIIGGYSDGTFRPNANATRGQISKIVANAAGFVEPVSGQRFTDVAPGSTFYEFIERLAARGVMGGYSDGTFRPNNDATRGQTAKIVANTFFPGCQSR